MKRVCASYDGVWSDIYTTINTGMDIGKNRVWQRVGLKPKHQRELCQKEMVNGFRDRLQQYGGYRGEFGGGGQGSDRGRRNQSMISLQGRDLRVLQRIADEFGAKMAKVPGVIDLESSLKEPRPTLSLHVDRERAADLGLSVGQIAAGLRPLLAGEAVTTWQAEDGENYDVRVQLAASGREERRRRHRPTAGLRPAQPGHRAA
ncbi:MAG: efflux RND transporter permease subunit [Chryseolinea sp.]